MFLIQPFGSCVLMISMDGALVVRDEIAQWDGSMILRLKMMLPYEAQRSKWDK